MPPAKGDVVRDRARIQAPLAATGIAPIVLLDTLDTGGNLVDGGKP